MPLARIEQLEVTSFRLEVPYRDFDHLPRWLGCSLERRQRELVLATEQPGCSLRFDVDGEWARLAEVTVKGDVQGRFTQQVLGTLLLRYEGDLDAVAVWAPRRATPRLVVRGGETSHPLFAPLVGERPGEPETTSDRVEALLAEARAAWEEHLRLKASRDRQRPDEPDPEL